jgi:hypothetical protein
MRQTHLEIEIRELARPHELAGPLARLTALADEVEERVSLPQDRFLLWKANYTIAGAADNHQFLCSVCVARWEQIPQSKTQTEAQAQPCLRLSKKCDGIIVHKDSYRTERTRRRDEVCEDLAELIVEALAGNTSVTL